MRVREQIWIYVNGHEWLARRFATNKICFTNHDNDLVGIGDRESARKLGYYDDALASNRPRLEGVALACGVQNQRRLAGTAEPFRVARPEAVVLACNKPVTAKSTRTTRTFSCSAHASWLGSAACAQDHLLSWGTVTVAVTVLLFPALSVAVAVMV